MLDNHAYNLMIQLVEEHKSVWRMREYYMNDAGDCVDCKKFWEKLAEDKEAHIRVLEEEIKKHLDHQ